ncbi:TIGR03086 family metal-binding protein [Actinoallomurus sp. CA-142502]|uniref:TIGR03086 family metal-binding protein n=1 Tax=Actinoallomurus sp. CA-142502 TaxID=3239885 RepID=UPI003D928C45
MTAISWDVLDQAHGALRTTVAKVADADWKLPTPCEQWNAAQVLRHAAGDQLAYVAAITGSGGPSENPFEPAGDAPADPQELLAAALDGSVRAFATVSPGTQAVPSPLPQGSLPAETVVGAAALDAAVHAWDIAVAVGLPSPLSADLATLLMPVATTLAEPLRGFAYAPALAPQPEDDAVAELLRYLGRRPDWAR